MDSVTTGSPAALAQQILTLQAGATQHALGIEMLRQQAQDERGIVALLEQATSPAQATLPAGQGGAVDVTV